MLWLALAAHAAPNSPAPVMPTGIEVAAVYTGDRHWLYDLGCASEACEAVRTQTMAGVEVDLRPLKFLGFYLNGGYLTEAAAAADYAGTGWGIGGGLKAGWQLTPQFGVHAWGGVAYQRTQSLGDEETGTPPGANHAERFLVDVGGAVSMGSADDNFIGWIGASGLAFGDDAVTTLDGTLTLELMPNVPAEAVAGVMVVSDPLGGPWSRRGRLAAGLGATAGFRTGISGWLTASY